MALALGAGALTAIGGALLLAPSPEPDAATLRSLLPRSVTTPIAMGVAEPIDGEPSRTAALVILTGIIGALIADDLLSLLRVEEPAIRGFAMGLAAHGIGAARALHLHAEAGAFATLGMILNAVLTAALLPVLVN
ncbi:MAG: LrgB family protein [Oscillochloridaceae bacterium]|nr:LrgB family protein [Chloroflexaceae bacterium]MDW8390490.1 LrgB family protein [Oscillochloridaceae bacterium]